MTPRLVATDLDGTLLDSAGEVSPRTRAALEATWDAGIPVVGVTGRGPRLLDSVRVDYYGVSTPVHQMATVAVPEPRLITIKPWEKGQAKVIDKAIRESNLGLNPQTEGQVIRVPIPDLNEERRRELTRVAAKYAEQALVSARNVRRDGLYVLKRQEKDGDITQDEHRKLQHDVQTLTDDSIKKIDDLLAQKDKEILQV